LTFADKMLKLHIRAGIAFIEHPPIPYNDITKYSYAIVDTTRRIERLWLAKFNKFCSLEMAIRRYYFTSLGLIKTKLHKIVFFL